MVLMPSPICVIPAKAGIQWAEQETVRFILVLDTGFRRYDGSWIS